MSQTQYTPIIGMEVHVELATNTGIFCGCKNDPDAKEPNINICEICTAQPGTLPVPNKKAIAWTVLIGKALGCRIREISKFDRKHYFYPDLPKNYQISQYDEPIAEGGKMILEFPLGENIRDIAEIGITRAHLEEDAAKLFHDKDGNTLVDFNRASVPLVEIVTDPDFQTALEAKTYCQELRNMLRYLGVSGANMEKGEMRCEANVSLQESGKFEIKEGIVKALDGYTLNPKVELKNINSFRALERAIEYEIHRQTQMLEAGESWVQQTRGWDEDKGETVLQRTKQNAQDYRYFPEPDIPPFEPLTIAGEMHLPELPWEKRKRFREEYGFSFSDAKILTDTKELGEFTEQVMSEVIEWLHSLPEISGNSDEIREKKRNHIARLSSNWLSNNFMALLTEHGEIKISAENFAELIALIFTERVNSTNAHKILVEMFESGTDTDPTHIMEERGYGQIRDEAKLTEVIERIIESYPAQVEEYKAGKETVLKFLLGMVMRATEGSADPKMVEEMLKAKLS